MPACSFCFRDECDRCHDANCECCGTVQKGMWFDEDPDDYIWE